MTFLKPDAEQIKQFLDNLAQESWVKRSERHWWPRFLFHYTDVKNAVSILRDNRLLSRQEAVNHNRLSVSSGSSTILAGTDADVKAAVRFYFRPQTPTQYHVEGIRSQKTLAQSKFPDAHCPVPIFFLFDAKELLTQQNCWFSDGNLGSAKAQKLSTAAELAALPWQKIYHTGRFDPQRENITFYRNAEVVVPGSLDLTALRYIGCRSEAEKETLLHLLSPPIRQKYQNQIIATSRITLFFKSHTFLQAARMSSNSIVLNFSPDTKSPGPFEFSFDLIKRSETVSLARSGVMANKSIPINLKQPASVYSVRVQLDGHLVYANSFREVPIPF